MPERTIPLDENDWSEASRAVLGAGLARLESLLRKMLADDAPQETEEPDPLLLDGKSKPSQPGALDRLVEVFDLSPFERDVVLLCAGVELSSSFAALVSAFQQPGKAPTNEAIASPTFSLALAALPEAHWSALTPNAPLRHWRLIELGTGTLTLATLRIDERILHYLTGILDLDGKLLPLLESVGESVHSTSLIASHHTLVEQATAAWKSSPLPEMDEEERLPVITLCGPDLAGKEAVAVATSARMGRRLYRLDAQLLPTAPAELDNLLILLEREASLSHLALLLDGETGESAEGADNGRRSLVQRVAERYGGPLILLLRNRLPLGRRMVINLDVEKPTAEEQRHLWQETLQHLPTVRAVLKKDEGTEIAARLASQFNLSATTIHAAARQATGLLQSDKTSDGAENVFWNACRMQARPRLEDLTQRIMATTPWDALVLPEAQQQLLSHIVAQVRQRQRVYGEWGFAKPGERGVGITALFAGPSGTGKTMAAEVIAHTLALDLYRIDLSQVVSKYIGETEKNLRRIFDAAEEGGAVLLFDEADALFGKRSEVKDSHDRYANVEVSYLLQRMEAYRGLAILTTNLRSALDVAFVRRLRFIVPFPFPDAAQRAAIWTRAFPAETPTEKLDPKRLAQWNVAGGNIRSAALNAAFLAAEAGEAVRMCHLFQAAQIECAKLDKPLTEAETVGWLSNETVDKD